MKKILILKLLVVLVYLPYCSMNSEKNNQYFDKGEGNDLVSIKADSIMTKSLDTIMLIEPSDVNLTILDSIITDSGVFILQQKALDSYAVQQHVINDNEVYIKKYRELSFELIDLSNFCKKEVEFQKIDFKNYIPEKDFSEIYITGFFLVEKERNVIKILSRLCYPDSDYCYSFLIHLDLLNCSNRIELLDD